ncbi:DUF805 domain-containing protein [Pontivivens insulae]|nr:DUF805 domain-containing protein [Pontivivens insulae]
MSEAIRSVLQQYVGFTGRARRSEYWWWTLAVVLATIIVSVVEVTLGLFGLSTILSLAIFLPGLAVSVRRLHDTGRSGWWLLVVLVPLIGFLIILFFAIQDSQPGTNDYGPNPKGA